MTGPPVALGFDLGGTKMSACSIDATGAIVEHRLLPSPAFDPEDTVRRIIDAAVDLGPSLPLGVGLAGISDHDGNFVYGPNFQLAPFPFRDRIVAEWSAPVTIGNEGRFALWAEHQLGAARGHDNVVMVLLGTGVGGALILDGQLYKGAHGFAGELGHTILSSDGPACRSPMPGSLECHCSGRAIEGAARRKIAAGAPSVLASRDDIDGRAVTDAAGKGDELAQEVLRQVGHDLGIGIASFVNALDPSLIVLGGGVLEGAATWILPAARSAMQERIMGVPHRDAPQIVLPAFDNSAGMIGAALWAAQQHDVTLELS